MKRVIVDDVVNYICDIVEYDLKQLEVIKKNNHYFFNELLALYDNEEFEKLNKVLEKVNIEKYEIAKEKCDWIFKTEYNNDFINYIERIIYKK